jgi:hypothetical protein
MTTVHRQYAFAVVRRRTYAPSPVMPTATTTKNSFAFTPNGVLLRRLAAVSNDGDAAVRDSHMEISARVTSGAVHVRMAEPCQNGMEPSTARSCRLPEGCPRSDASVRRRGLSGRCSSTCPLYRQVAALRLVKLCCCRRRPEIRRSDGNRLLHRSATVHHRGSAAPQCWSTGMMYLGPRESSGLAIRRLRVSRPELMPIRALWSVFSHAGTRSVARLSLGLDPKSLGFPAETIR